MAGLPDPTRPACISLPLELLAHILRLGQEDEPIAEQCALRLNFGSVCRDWYECDNRWRVISVTGVDKVERLLEVWAEVDKARGCGRTSRTSARAGGEGPKSAALAVKSLGVRVRGFISKDMLAAITRLLSKVWSVEAVEVVASTRTLGSPSEQFNSLGKAVGTALIKLSNIKHFTFGSASKNDCVILNKTWLARLVSHWPKLKSLTFHQCFSDDAGSILRDTLVSSCGAFSSLTLLHGAMDFWDADSLLYDLPPSTRSIEINSRHFFPIGPESALIIADDCGLKLAPQLERVTLRNGEPWHPLGRDRTRVTSQRGRIDKFIAKLANVTDLDISPCAVSDLGLLADLKKLTHLTVVLGAAAPTTPLKSIEFLDLFNRSESLTRVDVSRDLITNWTDDKKEAVEAAAGPRVRLRWI